MILGFSHPAIVVSDLERARAFYEEMFGFEVIAIESWDSSDALFNAAVGLSASAARGYVLQGHNCFFEIWEYASPPAHGPEPSRLGAHEPGIRHLAFLVDDVTQELARLVHLGGTAMNPPVGNAGFGYLTYARDPFGNIIELSTVAGSSRPLTTLPGVRCDGAYRGPQTLASPPPQIPRYGASAENSVPAARITTGPKENGSTL
jgi:catechol 2,3-dioxygenase-like lactoylglutathione lyase family enzyme